MPQYLPGIVQMLYKRLVVADLMASGTTDSNAITYMVETLFTNAAAAVLEGAAKPESALTFDQKTDPVSKIAHWLPVTEELLEDVARSRATSTRGCTLGVQLAEEDQLLNGNGTPPNLLGLLNRAGPRDGRRPQRRRDAAGNQRRRDPAADRGDRDDGVRLSRRHRDESRRTWSRSLTSKDSSGQYLRRRAVLGAADGDDLGHCRWR